MIFKIAAYKNNRMFDGYPGCGRVTTWHNYKPDFSKLVLSTFTPVGKYTMSLSSYDHFIRTSDIINIEFEDDFDSTIFKLTYL